MNKFRPALRRIAEFLLVERVNPSTCAMPRFEDGYLIACPRKLPSGHQARGSCAYDHHSCFLHFPISTRLGITAHVTISLIGWTP